MDSSANLTIAKKKISELKDRPMDRKRSVRKKKKSTHKLSDAIKNSNRPVIGIPGEKGKKWSRRNICKK